MRPFFGRYANMQKSAILEVVKEALSQKNLSASQASQLATGSESLISNLARARYGSPTVESLQSLADVLDLEFYFGPPRPRAFGGFQEAAGPGLSPPERPTEVVIPRFIEDTGQGDGPGPLALTKKHIKDLEVSAADLAVVRAVVDDPHASIACKDIVLLHTKRPFNLDGSCFAYFEGMIGRVRFGNVLQLNGGQIVAAQPSLVQLDGTRTYRILGAVIGVWKNRAPNDEVVNVQEISP